jgi:membrane associated rhomboid family serine protease
MHILFNMLMLWFFGRELESYMGRRKFAFLYLVSGVAGGLTQILVGVLLGGDILPHVVGASGAIYGILIYYALKWPDRTVIFIVISLRARTLALIMVGISVLYGFFPASGDSTSHMCHLGGALLGFLYFRYEGGYKRVVATIKVHQGQKIVQKSMDEEKEMDRLLLKIHEEGIHSLTDKERKFLNEASRRYRKS